MNLLTCITLSLALLDLATCGLRKLDEDDDDENAGSHDTILHFTYGENDETGPRNWDKERTIKGKSVPYVGNKLNTENHCRATWLSPANIDSNLFIHNTGEVLQAVNQHVEHEGVSETIVITITSEEIEMADWELGHPTDAYHGIDVRANILGLFQIFDTFDPMPDSDAFTTYDFHFMSIFYCDPDKVEAHRSMHQIDGKRFPLELEFVFFKYPKEIGIDQSILPYNDDNTVVRDNVAVILSVLGEVGEEENKYFQPIVDAAKGFHGSDFGLNDLDDNNVVGIKLPWSPTWLLPDASAYYYYNDGTFPVPPCWRVPRYYVMKDPIKISQKQLNVLTNIKTKREKGTGGRMPCTFSVIQTDILPADVTLNSLEYVMKGDDKRPRSEAEVLAKQERLKEMDVFQKGCLDKQFMIWVARVGFKINFGNAILIITPIFMGLYVIH
ncbi:Receptor-type tyrosine-protein phosphatase zeta [Orchesella cincta]|uniref:Receptor-type tyrosine-protein phosphatase zeta n=1 Tax=Orchesella cincta TaxID=48709 RepID=A0A1D2MQB4_ORCCI|nr:Receptor-type tyrosine-protein phosphatase zeta [Orchesella cincta]